MKVLWISSREMTEEERAGLRIKNIAWSEKRSKIQDDKVEVKKFDKPVSSWREVVEAGMDCDVFAIDLLPIDVVDSLANLNRNTKPVIFVTRRITGKDKHVEWQQVLSIKLNTLCI